MDPNAHDPSEHETTHEHAEFMAKLAALEAAIVKAKEEMLGELANAEVTEFID